MIEKSLILPFFQFFQDSEKFHISLERKRVLCDPSIDNQMQNAYK